MSFVARGTPYIELAIEPVSMYGISFKSRAVVTWRRNSPIIEFGRSKATSQTHAALRLRSTLDADGECQLRPLREPDRSTPWRSAIDRSSPFADTLPSEGPRRKR